MILIIDAGNCGAPATQHQCCDSDSLRSLNRHHAHGMILVSHLIIPSRLTTRCAVSCQLVEAYVQLCTPYCGQPYVCNVYKVTQCTQCLICLTFLTTQEVLVSVCIPA